MNELGFVDEN